MLVQQLVQLLQHHRQLVAWLWCREALVINQHWIRLCNLMPEIVVESRQHKHVLDRISCLVISSLRQQHCGQVLICQIRQSLGHPTVAGYFQCLLKRYHEAGE